MKAFEIIKKFPHFLLILGSIFLFLATFDIKGTNISDVTYLYPPRVPLLVLGLIFIIAACYSNKLSYSKKIHPSQKNKNPKENLAKVLYLKKENRKDIQKIPHESKILGKETDNVIPWDDIDTAFWKLEDDIKKYDPEVIIGLADGRIIASIIAANFCIPEFYIIDILVIQDESGKRTEIIEGCVGNIKGKKVLLVDNHIYTGKNMSTALVFLNKKEPSKIQTVVFFKHEIGQNEVDPDYFCHLLSGPRESMAFPWSYTVKYSYKYGMGRRKKKSIINPRRSDS